MKRNFVCLLSAILLLMLMVGTGIAEPEGEAIDRDALIGVWTFSVAPDKDDTGLFALNEDGTCQLGMTDISFSLQWELKGNTLRLYIPGVGETVTQMQVALDGDSLTLTEETGAVTEFTRVDGQPETEQAEPGPEAEFLLGEWDMYSPFGDPPSRIVFNRDGMAETHIDLDGSDIVLRIRWNYADGFLYFPTTSMYSLVLGTSDSWMQIAIEGERIVLIEDITLDEMITALGLGFDSRYVYVLTRPDNPLTEEEYRTLHEKYALPEEENTEAE